MRILPFNIILAKSDYKNNLTDYSQYRYPVLSCDTVSFSQRKTTDETILKELLNYDIPDMYTGKPLLSVDKANDLINSGIFSESIANIVDVLEIYKDYLQDNEQEVLKVLKQQAELTPNKKINEVLKILQPEHEEKLIESQNKVFEELKTTANDLPDNLKKLFNHLMYKTNKEIYKQPIYLKFEDIELTYNLTRIKNKIKKENNESKYKALQKLIKISVNLNTNRNNKKQNELLLQEMESIINNSCLKKDSQIVDLILQTKASLESRPVIKNFTRKPFIFELIKITDKLEDRKLARKLLRIAEKLPKSQDNVSAFIIKSVNLTPEKIGYNLINGSIGSIEHLKPVDKGGENKLSNYGLTSRYINSKRSNIDFAQWLNENPQTYINCQKYVDKLIELSNDGTLAKIGISKNYIRDFASTVYKLSGTKKKLLLDTGNLK